MAEEVLLQTFDRLASQLRHPALTPDLFTSQPLDNCDDPVEDEPDDEAISAALAPEALTAAQCRRGRRAGEYEDVGREHHFEDPRPIVGGRAVFTHVSPHSGCNVMIDGTDRVDVHAVLRMMCALAPTRPWV